MKVAAAPHLLLLLAFTFAVVSAAETASLQLKPRPFASFTVTDIQNLANCSYMVIIKTSCNSSQSTRDQIGLAFADAYGNQVYAPRLDDPFTGTFERCSSDTFQIDGPCTTDICNVYLYRTGTDGWEPESVQIYGPDSEPVTFYFNTSIPNGVWYGYDLCHTTPPPPPPPSSSSHQRRVPRSFVFMILGFVVGALF